MVMKDCLEKNVQKKVLIEKHREYYLVLDEETGAIFLVNETSHFLYENCDGQSVESLCELLFDQCIDKDQLDKRTVYEGCTYGCAPLCLANPFIVRSRIASSNAGTNWFASL